jgi:hypothetical protein
MAWSVLTFLSMVESGTRLIGYVQVQVGTQVVAVPVQAVDYDRDTDVGLPGGLFQDEKGAFGILVDGNASPEVVQAQIAAAAEEAGRRLAKKLLN